MGSFLFLLLHQHLLLQLHLVKLLLLTNELSIKSPVWHNGLQTWLDHRSWLSQAKSLMRNFNERAYSMSTSNRDPLLLLELLQNLIILNSLLAYVLPLRHSPLIFSEQLLLSHVRHLGTYLLSKLLQHLRVG